MQSVNFAGPADWVTSMLSLRPWRKMNGSIAWPLLVITPNIMMWTRCLVYIKMNVSLDTMKSLYWSFWHECQAIQRAISKFLEEWIASWCCFPHKPTLVCCTIDKTQNKWSTCMKVTIYPSYLVYIYIYIYKKCAENYSTLRYFENREKEDCYIQEIMQILLTL